MCNMQCSSTRRSNEDFVLQLKLRLQTLATSKAWFSQCMLLQHAVKPGCLRAQAPLHTTAVRP